MEKYGFIYLWFDKKRKMYYVGAHWGTKDDGYICSSNRMRDAYRRRPDDFKRRIISKINERNILLDEEHKWLSLIKDEELGKKYYNLRKHKWGHWTTDNNKFVTVSEKISNTLKGRKHSEETKKKISENGKGKHTGPLSEEHKKKMSEMRKGKPRSEEAKRKTSETLKGKPQSKELIEKRVQSRKNGKGWVVSEERKKQISETQIGRKLSEETKKKISESRKKYLRDNKCN